MPLRVRDQSIWCDSMLAFYTTLGRLFPRTFAKRLGLSIREAGFFVSGETLLGALVVASLCLSLGSFVALLIHPSTSSQLLSLPVFVVPVVLVLTLVLLVVGAFVVFFYTLRSILLLIAEERTRRIESILSDFLTLVSANVRSGMPLDQAMWHAARPEFGILGKEVKRYIKEAMGGTPFDKVLDELSKRFNSRLFRRAMLLLKEADETGGEVAKVLDITARETREELLVKKEISSMLVVYEIFVLFAAVIGTPFLFGVVTKLLAIMEKSFSYIPSTSYQAFEQSSIKPGALILSTEQFKLFSLIVILITSVSSSAIISIIKYGRKTRTVKYAPFVAFSSIIVFFATLWLLDAVLSRIG